MTPTWLTAFVDLPAGSFDDAVRFWCAVTGHTESARRGPGGDLLTLLPPDGDAYLRGQRLGSGGPRVHLDLHAPDPRSMADHAVALGATEVAAHLDHPTDAYVVLASPAGVPFCTVADAGAHAVRPTAVAWPGGASQVDQVCLDVAPSQLDDELVFWSRLLGVGPAPSTGREFRRLDVPDRAPLRFLVQRTDDERPAGLHLDLAADDREVEVARHEALGARVVHRTGQWTTLRDPAGLAYCVTDRRPWRARRSSAAESG